MTKILETGARVIACVAEPNHVMLAGGRRVRAKPIRHRLTLELERGGTIDIEVTPDVFDRAWNLRNMKLILEVDE